MDDIRILIVEDELLIAKNTAKKLRNLGYSNSTIVSSGKAAIDCVVSQAPHLILMDIAIQGSMDGIDTAIEIKAKQDIPIIFLTAYASDETLERASHTGCYGYLIKPFRDKELAATIKMALSKHQENVLIKKSLQETLNQYSLQLDNIYTNHITKLPNKLFLRDSFDYLISSLADSTNQNGSPEESHTTLVSIYNISLDRFKKISSLLAKEQQESAVREMAERINGYVSNLESQGIIVHVTNDNFIVMIPADKQLTGRKYAQDILNLCKQPITIERGEIFLSVSIGMACYPSDSRDIQQLIEQSQKALKHARDRGGNNCQSFTFAFNVKDSRASEKLSMEADLHYALERREFELYYQPKVNLKTNSIVGAEALVRWNHPTMGRVQPNKFISLAEESGLIKPIGEWILEEACKQTKAWHNAGFHNLKTSVNISGVQFKQSDLFHKITQILFNSALEPEYLELELTETILIDNIKSNVQKLNLIKKLGVKIALDDFGTGYSSLSYLQQFPFDTLKIDSCFIRNIDRQGVNSVITKTIIEMAHKLNLNVVAEGVETKAELKFISDCQCDEMQGFIFSRPLDVREFKNLIVKHKV